MKRSLLILSIFISLSTAAQENKDSSKINAGKVVPDSAMFYKDTLVFKIPGAYFNTLQAVFADKDYSHKQYIALVDLFIQQSERQVEKRPVQKTKP